MGLPPYMDERLRGIQPVPSVFWRFASVVQWCMPSLKEELGDQRYWHR